MLRNKNVFLVALTILTMCVVLAGCFNAANQPTEVPDETINPNGAPFVTTGPTTLISPAPGTTGTPVQAFDWATQASMVESRINMFSEIQESHIVTAGQTALVGIKFTGSYKGELTQRIRDMIAGEVMAADNTITVVAVTADPNDVTKIAELAQRQRSGASQAELQPEVDQLARNANTMR